MDVVPTLSISPDYLALLILKIRGVQAREGEVDPNSGSNPTDDCALDAVQDTPGDLSREEIREELQGPLLWIGRGDAEPEEWAATVELARQRKDSPTPTYLLRQPLAGEYLAEGADRVGISLDLSD
jgi:hypothetical protein